MIVDKHYKNIVLQNPFCVYKQTRQITPLQYKVKDNKTSHKRNKFRPRPPI